MNKADLIEVLTERLGDKAAAALAVEAFADVVMREVAGGGSVVISGFGTFEPVHRAARTGRNPRTGEAVPIAATTSPRFRPGSYFKDAVTDPAILPADGLAGARVGSESDHLAAPVKAAPARGSAATDAPAETTAAKASPAKRAAGKTSASTSAASKGTVRKTAPAKSAAAKSTATKSTAPKGATAKSQARTTTPIRSTPSQSTPSAPASVRRPTPVAGSSVKGGGSGSSKPATKPARKAAAVSGAPETVRAAASSASSPSSPSADSAAPGRVLSGGEEITHQMISAKKAQLAKVKSDVVAKAKAKADAEEKAAKSDKKSGKKDKNKAKDKKSSSKNKDGKKKDKKAKGKK